MLGYCWPFEMSLCQWEQFSEAVNRITLSRCIWQTPAYIIQINFRSYLYSDSKYAYGFEWDQTTEQKSLA